MFKNKQNLLSAFYICVLQYDSHVWLFKLIKVKWNLKCSLLVTLTSFQVLSNSIWLASGFCMGQLRCKTISLLQKVLLDNAVLDNTLCTLYIRFLHLLFSKSLWGVEMIIIVQIWKLKLKEVKNLLNSTIQWENMNLKSGLSCF